MQLTVKPYSRCPHAVQEQVRALYERAFPEVERVDLWKLRAMTARRGTRFDVYFDDGDPCGFTFSSALQDGAVYLLFLAVNDAVRSKGYGSAILSALKGSHGGRRIILEIEPVGGGAPNEEQRVRRLAFYLRNGFHETGMQTIERDVRYDVLTDEEGFDPDELARIMRRMSFGLEEVRIVEKQPA